MAQIFEVGVCVRDEIIGVHNNDIDFTVVLENTDKRLDKRLIV